jgi:chorismate mutase
VKLAEVRREIDRLDQRLLVVLGRRFQLVRLLGDLKAGAAMRVRDSAREANLLRARIASGRRLRLDPALVSSLFQGILRQSVREQTRAAKGRGSRTRAGTGSRASTRKS